MADRSGQRRIDACDIDAAKIEIAGKANCFGDRLKFECKAGSDLHHGTYDSIVICDVLYLLPYDRQEELIRNCRAQLKEAGTLLIKETDKKPRWKYLVNLCQETFSVKIAGITRGGKFYFRGSEGYERLLLDCGFAVRTVRLDRGYLHPHIVYIGTNNNLTLEKEN